MTVMCVCPALRHVSVLTLNAVKMILMASCLSWSSSVFVILRFDEKSDSGF